MSDCHVVNNKNKLWPLLFPCACVRACNAFVCMCACAESYTVVVYGLPACTVVCLRFGLRHPHTHTHVYTKCLLNRPVALHILLCFLLENSGRPSEWADLEMKKKIFQIFLLPICIVFTSLGKIGEQKSSNTTRKWYYLLICRANL